ncbi:hypothetical protein GFM11_33450 [Rhizobium leguminosarum bv. viciae]|uniref:LPO_1073/Vpar_1526 family protein n=1 Tax=Rhizobium leguminosarum TaxID=384 RepID=UPI001442590A|nr:LPO_1073/Vpar_1526 family protein [Rhizobium leguminosarum]NKK18063.1 hypothetical protein [Rhizobium leguminosarum bv. viciae]
MTDRQNAKAGNDAQIIQSGRDTYVGFTSQQVRDIVSELQKPQLEAFSAIARDVVDQRLQAFEKLVLKSFADGGAGNREAFREPDFQYLLTKAQHAFARSGDEELGEILVSMIETRSQEIGRTRVSLSLNEAIEKSAQLTTEEFAVITLCFLIRYCSLAAQTIEQLANSLKSFHELTSELRSETSSYEYIASLGLGSVGVFRADFMTCMRHTYMTLISTGFDIDQVDPDVRSSHPELMNDILKPCKLNPAKYQLPFSKHIDLLVYANKRGWNNDEQIQNLWNIFEATALTPDQFKDQVRPIFPEINNFVFIWDVSLLGKLSLTSVGMAIAHGNARRCGIPMQELSTWIK